jgi:uncharacterized protein
VILEVKVIPNAQKNEIIRREENRLVIKIKGVPEKGAVNKNLIDFLAKTLGIAKSQITIVAGHTSRLKKLDIQGICCEQITKLFSLYTEKYSVS